MKAAGKFDGWVAQKPGRPPGEGVGERREPEDSLDLRGFAPCLRQQFRQEVLCPVGFS